MVCGEERGGGGWERVGGNAKSPTQNPQKRPQTLKEFSDEQINTEQIRRVIDLFMENDDEWERIGDIEWETAYRKISP